uniref:Putative methyltransferase n=1 Tax=viral metagenome TaxID=1070528 RepID=A0A6M3J3D1_9ZZZZ
MKVTTWTGAYNNQWRGLIVPEAFAHPAKFSPGLIQRIYQHGIEQGHFEKGDVIGDPFGGVGGGGIFAAYAGLDWIGLELEAKFVDLANQNFRLHLPTWEAHGYPVPVIIQGDSRRFSEIVGECAAICTSPPYVDSMEKSGGIDPNKSDYIGGPNSQMNNSNTKYGQTPGQIGTLKAGDLDAVVTSPPYAEARITGQGDEGSSSLRNSDGSFVRGPEGWQKRKELGNRYGTDPANIGNLKCDGIVKYRLDSHTDYIYNSPKNQTNGGLLCDTAKIAEKKLEKKADGAKSAIKSMLVDQEDPRPKSIKPGLPLLTLESQCTITTEHCIKTGTEETTDGGGLPGEYKEKKHSKETATGAGIAESKDLLLFTTSETSQKQGGNGTTILKTSKPSAEHAITTTESKNFSRLNVNHADQPTFQKSANREPAPRHAEPNSIQQNTTDGEPNNNQTYWSEMVKIYRECHKALKPGGYLIVVVKAYVKNKRRVPLPQQTLKLLVNLNFEPVERIKAMLTQSTVQGGLFGEDIVNEKARKSFFRRLAEAKGSPRIDWEEVLIVRKPC